MNSNLNNSRNNPTAPTDSRGDRTIPLFGAAGLKAEHLQAMMDVLDKAATLKSEDLRAFMDAVAKAATTESNPIAFVRSVTEILGKGEIPPTGGY
jgi:hypothetical protein